MLKINNSAHGISFICLINMSLLRYHDKTDKQMSLNLTKLKLSESQGNVLTQGGNLEYESLKMTFIYMLIISSKRKVSKNKCMMILT